MLSNSTPSGAESTMAYIVPAERLQGLLGVISYISPEGLTVRLKGISTSSPAAAVVRESPSNVPKQMGTLAGPPSTVFLMPKFNIPGKPYLKSLALTLVTVCAALGVKVCATQYES